MMKWFINTIVILTIATGLYVVISRPSPTNVIPLIGFPVIVYLHYISKRQMYVPIILFAFVVYSAELVDVLIPGGFADSGRKSLVMLVIVLTLFLVSVALMYYLRGVDRKRERNQS